MKRPRVKKGQVRQWVNRDGSLGSMFLTVSSWIDRSTVRPELGWGGRNRGEILWKILEIDGGITDSLSQVYIFDNSKAIDETR